MVTISHYSTIPNFSIFLQFCCILGTGTFLNEVVERFQKLANGVEAEKFVVYCAHETNMVILLETLGYSINPIAPEFATAIYFELRVKNDQPYLNVIFKTKNNVQRISVCGFDCKLTKFKNMVGKYLIDIYGFDTECNEG